MANIFSSVMFPKVQSNVFDLSYDVKLSLNMGDLVPTHVQEIVPGDKITMSTESMLRFAPLIAPVMHKVDVYQHFFFVPNRILWSGWENFITDKKPAPAFPIIEQFHSVVGELPDYFGLRASANGSGNTRINEKISAFPFAAYCKIYDEFYRDQNLSPEISQPLVDGDNEWLYDHLQLKKRAWQHDYFTASLPFAQKGDAVTLPLGQFNDVEVKAFNGHPVNTITASPTNLNVDGEYDVDNWPDGVSLGGLFAKTSQLEAGASTINDLRRAFRLQEWLEKNARGGTRYVESILSHFGVTSSDARLQRPEYLGGSKQPMVISEVLQTAEGAETPQGNMSGHGISVGSGKQFTFKAEEHGYIIGIMSVMPKTAYQQGIPKHFSKFDRLDFYWPSFAHLGEQEVLNKELYYDLTDEPSNNSVFGYVPRYSEYKYNDSRVAGDFRDSLSFWHMGRIFDSRPNLNKDFIECKPTTRIFAVEDPSVHKIYGHIFHRIKAVRKMPKYGTPQF